MLERFHLEELGSRQPYELSGGQRQRGAIARAILSQPSLLLLDEPTRGLDAALRQEFYSVLREARSAFGIPVVMVTHDIEEAVVLADRIVVMRPHPGRVQETLPVDLPRPRNRLAPAFDLTKRNVLRAINRSLAEHPAGAGAATGPGFSPWV